MSITLVVTAGPHLGRTYTFDRHDTFLVGRSESANLSLPDDPYFSRMQFLVEVNPPLCRLSDLNSHNGTLVNGRRVQAIDLHEGDEICAGKTSLRVAVTEQQGSATLDLPAPLATGTYHAPPPLAPTPLVPTPLAPNTAEEQKLVTQEQALHRILPRDEMHHRPHSTVASTPPPLPGAMFSDVLVQPLGLPEVRGHRLVGELGRGGMGVVYHGVCEVDGREVAIKMIRPCCTPSPTAVGRFLREASILQELRHPRIVCFRDSGLAGTLLYFVMDFVAGLDAAKLVATQGPLEARRAVRLTLQLLDALAFAHQKGYVHRDVKPANLLVTGSPPLEELRVADFGLARTYQESALSGLTLSGTAGGTPKFMPPEQVTDFRNARPAADQYSAAATLYYLLSGRHGYEGQVADLFRKLLLEDPVPITARCADLSPGLAAVIHRALARKPEARYADVSAFAQALQPFA